MELITVILAAGQGTRMKSSKAKVLHQLAGKTMIARVVESVVGMADKTVIVYGHNGIDVRETELALPVTWVEQKEQLGTGHAVKETIGEIDDLSTILILYGDVPLIKQATLKTLVSKVNNKQMALLTINLDDPTGYGRIIRESDSIKRIVEQKDATAAELLVSEINTGIMAVNGQHLKKWLAVIDNSNAQGEYYLTDIIEMAVSDGVKVLTTQPSSEYEVMGVNSRIQLNELERYYQRTLAVELMASGITLADKNRIDIRGAIEVKGTDSFIDINNVFEGEVSIGENVSIGPNCVIINVQIGNNVIIKANCVLENCIIGENCTVGPFARLRPGSELSDSVHVGNFVEIKKSKVGNNSKVNHLSYIGDAEIGNGVNIGAGTITCNYDGVNKYRTTIENGAFIGSGTQLVAPVNVGKGATLGAGTTLTKDAPNEALTVTRAKQITLKNWKKPTKE